MGQSIVLSEIRTEVLLQNDDPAYQNFLLQQDEERISSFSQIDRARKLAWMEDVSVLLRLDSIS